ncbi:hypothetical protein PTXU04_00018 [Escherichia phage PTXU04]|uniref:Tail fiber protein n=1 Tax=Escherichia phage PTXU04 TaxID=2508206 RepID=A0A482MTW1_9CAUD|nr:hypothetical protein HOV50_gp18 [Escherichia phage PTXU04]QBQ76632.1 hypothetical protein PTXU04_00018 [Escherichia phage PTXU04]
MSNQYYNFINPAEAGTIVDPFDYNREMEKITEAFSVVPPASQLTSGTLNYSTDTGTGNDHIATLDDFDTDYVAGSNVALRINDASTGPSTLSVNGLAAKDVTLSVFGAVAAGDLFAEGVYTFVFNGERFQILEMGARYYTTAFEQLSIAQAKAALAAASEAAALSERNAAAASAANALTSANAITASKDAAAGSATSAANSASAAAGSATSAANSASAANTSAVNSASSATAAANSATAAANSATASDASATAAANSATAAAGSAADAATYAQEAIDIVNAPNFLDRVQAAILELELFPGCTEFFDADIDPNVKYPGTTWVRLPASTSLRMSNATGSDVNGTTGADSVTLSTNNLASHNHSVTMGTVSSTDLGTDTLASVDLGTDTLANTTIAAKTTSSFDYGTKTASGYDPGAISTSGAGGHSHTFTAYTADGSGVRIRSAANDSTSAGNVTTSSAGNHTHTVALGAHTHTVALGAHTHTFPVGSHTHTVALGAHSHTVAYGSHGHSATLSLSNTGSGTSFGVVESSLILVAWYRSA